MNAQRVWLASDAAATAAIGAALAERLQPGSVVFLHGELGAGKTTLVRGLLQHLLPGQRVKSPTYSLVERYQAGAMTILHLDLYRTNEPGVLEFIGIREDIGRAVLLVEWPEKAAAALPAVDLDLWLAHCDGGREIRMQAHTARGRLLLPGHQPELDRT